MSIQQIICYSFNRVELTPEQIQRIHAFKTILAEVETSPIEIALSNFSGEPDPGEEIVVWEKIAKKYEEELKTLTNPTMEEKTELYKKILMESFFTDPLVLQLK